MEKALDVYEDNLEGTGRVRATRRERKRLFIKFMTLMTRIRIQNILRRHDENVLATKEKKDSVNGMSVDEAILSLSTLMAIGNTSDWSLTAITKNVGEIFELEEPMSGQIVLS